MPTRTLESIAPHSGGYTLTTDGPEIRILFLTDDIVRIRASFDKKFAEESYTLVMTAWEDRLDPVLGNERKRVEPVRPAITENDKTVTLSTSGLKLVIHRDPFAIEIFDSAGNRLHSDLRRRAYHQDHLGRIFHYAERGASDNYYGFGESAGHMNKAGRRVRINPKDAIGHDPEFVGCMYKHIPFYIKFDGDSRVACGLFYHNFCDSEFEMGSEISGYWPPYSYYTADGGDIDLFFINGPTIGDVIRRYTDLAGKTVLPPKYSLGYLGSTMYYSELPEKCDDEIIDFVDRNFEEGIPVDAFHLSSGFSVSEDDGLRYAFTWNLKRFPDPERFFAEMAKRGVAVSPNIKPGMLLTHPNYADFDKAHAYVKNADGTTSYVDQWWGGRGSFVDFTNPEGRRLWIDLMTRQLLDKGATAIWNDNNEFETNDRSAICDVDGKPQQVSPWRSQQPTLMSYCTHKAMTKALPDVRPFVLTRSGSAGIQRYSQTWAGDNLTGWPTLKFNVATILNMGLSGVANNGCDIGGFAGPSPEPELLVRWVQNGIFQPRFSIHSCNSNNTVTEPWTYANHLPLIRDAIALRYQLIPYFYSLMREANRTGLPIMRPLVMEFPHDKTLDSVDTQFMLGSFLMVANVLDKGVDHIDVRLPAGCDWYCWHTRKRFAGGQVITVPVTLASIPMFIRDGAIIPTTSGLESIARQDIDTLTLIVAPRHAAELVLYEDDGKTNAYRNGEYRETTLSLTPGAKAIVSFRNAGRFDSRVKHMRLDVINEEKGAYWVSVAGKSIPQFLARKKWEAATEGWIYEGTTSSVKVKYPAIKEDHEVVVSFEHFDLIGMDEKDE